MSAKVRGSSWLTTASGTHPNCALALFHRRKEETLQILLGFLTFHRNRRPSTQRLPHRLRSIPTCRLSGTHRRLG